MDEQSAGDNGLDERSLMWSECFDLDGVTGLLTRKKRPRHHFKSDKAWRISNALCQEGKAVGTDDGMGYLQVYVFGKLHRVHRIVWEMVNGSIPSGFEVDHKDRVRSNNAPINLRLASSSQNKQNMLKHSDNRTGFKGIHENKYGRYCAQIAVDKKRKYLGLYDTAEEAQEAYSKAAHKHHGQFARTS